MAVSLEARRTMLYPESDRVKALKRQLESFMDRYVYPNEERFYKEAEELGPWKVYPVVEELKPKARAEGLWNLFLPEGEHGGGLNNLEYARLCEIMGQRASSRIAFGKPVSEQTVTQEPIAEARIMNEQARLLTLNAAHAMDTVGNKVAKSEIAMIKVAVPNIACQIVDWAIQVHGGGGTSNDFGLAAAYATARLLRLADGPDEVHRNQVARLELRKHRN
jgi:alkylation response protein AidB-like acyl-CoA dehydrogenase